MPRWEYCAIDSVYEKSGEGLAAYYRGLSQFTADGIRRVQIKDKDPKALAQARSQLGEEEWEMVVCGNTGPGIQTLYFKRPKP